MLAASSATTPLVKCHLPPGTAAADTVPHNGRLPRRPSSVPNARQSPYLAKVAHQTGPVDPSTRWRLYNGAPARTPPADRVTQKRLLLVLLGHKMPKVITPKC